MGRRAIDCFVVCGLPAAPTTVGGTRGFVGAAGETYRPEVLECYPPMNVQKPASTRGGERGYRADSEGGNAHKFPVCFDSRRSRRLPLNLQACKPENPKGQHGSGFDRQI
jgi:hypothetical protein